MATVLEFPNRARLTAERRSDGHVTSQGAGELVLFPGVRREHTSSLKTKNEKRKTNGK